ncbi:nicotinate-nucleotide diphosphorylase (carboxylating) [Candidatus Wirthbacteria bacterium CG2_30_54_11]|uniref:nicotinate-nucleotide diphosphorylase (carboxylating) n=1 Tax=Candidatus Wirthbacteria bacterium CG2_30_54_11 TaxID=1817892 RepID=A0A1J5ICN7_9BACT|nr:MAG: nicotinate-nucleotide diphosphorylase (carboxylating) [Candidatus Wirthbacteria bacterium CG2_30_54_11]
MVCGEADVSQGLLTAFPDLKEHDISTVPLLTNRPVTIQVYAKETGVLSGMGPARDTFAFVDPRLKCTELMQDGDPIKPMNIALEVSGDLWSLLVAERTALNFVSHLSGIATRTRVLVDAIAGTATRFLDTRKTIPGYRQYAKQAVIHGGGLNHRIGLYDMVLVKNNHIDAIGSITQAVQAVRAKWGKQYPIEVEARDLDEVGEALACGVDRIMFDNMPLVLLREAVKTVDHQTRTEASGDITLETIRTVAETGVDFISVGGDLTLAPPRLDFSLRIK